ncbi:hypothetical protein, partial [Methylomonas rosea]
IYSIICDNFERSFNKQPFSPRTNLFSFKWLELAVMQSFAQRPLYEVSFYVQCFGFDWLTSGIRRIEEGS